MTADGPAAEDLLGHIRREYGDGEVALHRPVFVGDERRWLRECVESNFVSTAGSLVGEFERRLAAFTGAAHVVATVNGTSALHLALRVAGVERGDEVLTQALSFVATANAIAYTGAEPVFLDVDADSLGLSPVALAAWLHEHAERRDDGRAWNRRSGRRIAACVPMHTFGNPLRIAAVVAICAAHGIPVVEDAAEALGSRAGDRHAGTFGALGVLSFNGNKVITTGGGGAVLTDDAALAARARHLGTTARCAHPYEFVHDEVGFNYRLPNLNAALGCAQMESLPMMLTIKAEVAARYRRFFRDRGVAFVEPLPDTSSNHWLNAIVLASAEDREPLLEATARAGVMTRPVWRLLSQLPMYAHCAHDGLAVSRELAPRLLNLPSSVPEREFARLRP
ncbi:LegC family aminotransferase [Arenimonas composti]|uniref:Aminotransferase DegT n=1 Tax=Arenimonas composti TR7-09 = DSM 18010 TaxID=1121013 RepID=A0A091BI74_9GAMM|nr:LegC family aminotransferase [Arenimonas composti]KFN51436.1 hypothetical protein P873_02570 [Arenimonas composti TR7-09 = DSM 18010]